MVDWTLGMRLKIKFVCYGGTNGICKMYVYIIVFLNKAIW